MKTQRTNSFVLILCIAMIAISGCKESSSTTNPTGTSLTGTLVYDIPSGDNNIGMYSFSSQSASVAFKDGHCPTWMPNGEVLYEVPSDLLPDSDWKIATIAQNGTNKKVLLDSKMFNLLVKKSKNVEGRTNYLL
ncbi:MAG: hypothetical protein IPM69_19710 [Ignavibacteria bacterium]|nr:hypothetical protein [Ignavibacteria bacterium]